MSSPRPILPRDGAAIAKTSAIDDYSAPNEKGLAQDLRCEDMIPGQSRLATRNQEKIKGVFNWRY